MIGNFLGFGGRIGRLRYFLLCTGLGFGVGVASLALMMLMAGGMERVAKPSVETLLPVILIVLPLYLWGVAVLVTKRLRDMGWAPGFVILLWLGLAVIDIMLAEIFPAFAVGNQTPMGLLLNLGLSLALLFWPGSDADDTPDQAPPQPFVFGGRGAGGTTTMPRSSIVRRSRSAGFGQRQA